MKPKVTIGVCVRNCENSVKKAIDSIREQDFPHELMEVIFVEDGSKDRTLSIILDSVSRMDMQVKVFHPEWMGLGVARNAVVDNASGDYIVWVDGDMILTKDFIRKQVGFMEKNNTIGIGKGKYGISNEENLVANLENIDFIINDFKCVSEMATKPLGTGGSIYRIEAIRQVGGFDNRIKGVGEDMDVECRIKAIGWLLCKTSAVFYERRRETWKALWDEYFWHGYGGHLVFHKNSAHILGAASKVFPPASILIQLLRSCAAYRLTRRKVVFLLPLHWVFKRIAWCLGFIMGYIRGYERPIYTGSVHMSKTVTHAEKEKIKSIA